MKFENEAGLLDHLPSNDDGRVRPEKLAVERQLDAVDNAGCRYPDDSLVARVVPASGRPLAHPRLEDDFTGWDDVAIAVFTGVDDDASVRLTYRFARLKFVADRALHQAIDHWERRNVASAIYQRLAELEQRCAPNLAHGFFRVDAGELDRDPIVA